MSFNEANRAYPKLEGRFLGYAFFWLLGLFCRRDAPVFSAPAVEKSPSAVNESLSRFEIPPTGEPVASTMSKGMGMTVVCLSG